VAELARSRVANLPLRVREVVELASILRAPRVDMLRRRDPSALDLRDAVAAAARSGIATFDGDRVCLPIRSLPRPRTVQSRRPGDASCTVRSRCSQTSWRSGPATWPRPPKARTRKPRWYRRVQPSRRGGGRRLEAEAVAARLVEEAVSSGSPWSLAAATRGLAMIEAAHGRLDAALAAAQRSYLPPGKPNPPGGVPATVYIGLSGHPDRVTRRERGRVVV
jgi:hypothetical protein